MVPPADVAKLLDRPQQPAGGDLAERDEDRRADDRELQVEVRGACLNLTSAWLTVRGRGHRIGRPTHHSVRDVHGGSGQAKLGQEAVERLSDRADERAAGGVLVLSRSLTEEDEPRGGWALPEHDMLPCRRTERAPGAVGSELREEPQPALTAVPIAHAPPPLRVNCSRR
jgi:hypothetical protein